METNIKRRMVNIKRDVDMIKYTDIERLGSEENESIFVYPEDELIIEEKIDGGNSSFFIEDGLIHMCSRNRDLTTDRDEKTFSNQRKYLYHILNGKELNPDYIYYGEWGMKHTLTYDSLPGFVGFDIRVKTSIDGKAGDFLSYDAMKKEYDRLGIEIVPLLDRIKVKDFLKKKPEEYIIKSKYGNTLMEGIVIKNYERKNVWGRQIFAKIVREEFKEQNKATFGKIKLDTNNDAQKIVDQFATNARIRKNILKLVNEGGNSLDTKLMQYLPIQVIEDIFKEETSTILKKYKNIDTRVLKKLVSSKCLLVIHDMMNEKVTTGVSNGL
jgi:hypothetical protein